MVPETSFDDPESASNILALDDVSSRYAKAGAALKACDANLGTALPALQDSPASISGASAFGEAGPAASISWI